MGKGKVAGFILGVLVLIGMMGSCADNRNVPAVSEATYTPIPEYTLAPTERASAYGGRATTEATDWLGDLYNDSTPTPVVSTPASTVEYATLSSGDSSDEVRNLQTRLIELGFLTVGADGDYGSKTVSAVKKAQALAGLEVTGVADAETQMILWAYDAPTTQPKPTKLKPTPTPEPEYEEPSDESCDYIANKSTKKFHYPDCSSVDQMKEKNKWYFTGSRETLIKKGYDPCKRCNP